MLGHLAVQDQRQHQFRDFPRDCSGVVRSLSPSCSSLTNMSVRPQSIADLSSELHQSIVSHLDLTRDLASLMQTCRAFRKAVAPKLWSYVRLQIDNLTRESWPQCMYVDDDLRKNLPLVSETPNCHRHVSVEVGTFPGFCRIAANLEQLKYVETLLISIPFYTKHEESEKISLSTVSEYDDYLAWFARNIGQLFPNVKLIEVESDTLYNETVTVDYPLLPRILKAFPRATKNLKLSLTREMELFDKLLPFEFRIIKLRYGYTQIIGETICSAGDDEITAKVKIGRLPSTVERFEIETEHRIVDLGDLVYMFSNCNHVKMLSMDVNHEFKNLDWLPDSVRDLNFCGLPSTCPPKVASGLTRLAICLEEMKAFQSLQCPNLEHLHLHSLQPEETPCQSFMSALQYCPNVKRLKCSGASAKTIATIVKLAKWELKSLALEYDPYQSVQANTRLAQQCPSLESLWICTHKGSEIVDILHAFTSNCSLLKRVYLTWQGWVWKIGDLLENNLISVVPKSRLIGKISFLDSDLYNQTFELKIEEFNRYFGQRNIIYRSTNS